MNYNTKYYSVMTIRHRSVSLTYEVLHFFCGGLAILLVQSVTNRLQNFQSVQLRVIVIVVDSGNNHRFKIILVSENESFAL